MLSGDGTQSAPTLRDNEIGDKTVADMVATACAGVDGLRDVDTSALSNEDRRALVQHAEYLVRVITGCSHTWINQLIEQHGLDVYPGSVPYALADMLNISGAQGRERVRTAARLGHTTTPTGEVLEPKLAATAAALRDGAISVAHAKTIDKFERGLSSAVDAETKQLAEKHLATTARAVRPEGLKQAAKLLEAAIDEDGKPPPDPKEKKRRRKFWMGPQDKDGWAEGGFITDAEGYELMRTFFDAWAKPGKFVPADDDDDDSDAETAVADATNDDTDDTDDTDDSGRAATAPAPGQDSDSDSDDDDDDDAANDENARDDDAGDAPTPEPVLDVRTMPQRQHDAFVEMLRRMIRSGMLGTNHGVDAVPIVTMTLADLEKGTGLAMTAAGSMLSIRDAVRMTARSRPYLLVFDDDGRPLYLGRSRRIANKYQRWALFATERGCTFPECTRPATWSQVHHTKEWADGGYTDIDVMTLACEAHHPLVGTGDNQWATTKAPPGHPYAGRTLWHPPAALDPTRTGRVNHYHHPIEMLLENDPTEHVDSPQPPGRTG